MELLIVPEGVRGGGVICDKTRGLQGRSELVCQGKLKLWHFCQNFDRGAEIVENIATWRKFRHSSLGSEDLRLFPSPTLKLIAIVLKAILTYGEFRRQALCHENNGIMLWTKWIPYAVAYSTSPIESQNNSLLLWQVVSFMAVVKLNLMQNGFYRSQNVSWSLFWPLSLDIKQRGHKNV